MKPNASGFFFSVFEKASAASAKFPSIVSASASEFISAKREGYYLNTAPAILSDSDFFAETGTANVRINVVRKKNVFFRFIFLYIEF